MTSTEVGSQRLGWTLALIIVQVLTAAGAYLLITLQRLGIAACGGESCRDVGNMWAAGDVFLNIIAMLAAVSVFLVLPATIWALRRKIQARWTLMLLAAPVVGIAAILIGFPLAFNAFQQGLPS